LPIEQIERRLRASIEQQPQREPLGLWAAELKETGGFVGWFGLLTGRFDVPEIGFMLPRARWGEGYATEIASRLLRFAFDELGHVGIVATTRADNRASIRVLEKLGFALETESADDRLGQVVAIRPYRLSRRLDADEVP
jgi:RimJ/RimL family protein N-acetyltransferase